VLNLLFVLFMKKIVIFIIFLLLGSIVTVYFIRGRKSEHDSSSTNAFAQPDYDTEMNKLIHPLQIEQMRKKDYPGNMLTVERTLNNGNGFSRQIVSYLSEGLRINGLLAIPDGEKPEGGFPAIVFNHGYIRPETYEREEKYVAYIAGFASKGYVVFMPDYRGHQDSEGKPLGAYFSPAYTTDAINAFYSLAQHTDVNPERIGMWGHSMGGHITLRAMVIKPDIKAGVIWAGVVASYEDMLENWRRDRPWRASPRENMANRPGRSDLIAIYGEIDKNRDFWESISPIYFVEDISGPVQLHHGLSDSSVPWEFSKSLEETLLVEGKSVEYYEYQGADHNLSGSAFTPAISRSVEFFNKYL
jgi:dipeptidyl aminopeptidase/acylaminoacyl peptidase